MGNGGTSKIALPETQLPEGYTAIVTSGYVGMAYEVSKVIAMMGGRVILAGDSPSRAKAAMLRMKADYIEARMKEAEEEVVSDNMSMTTSDSTNTELKVEFLKVNLKSLRSVDEFIEKFKEKGYGLHLLVCNHAIIQVPQGYTEDNFEMHFQVNYLSHLLMTLKLLPLMKVTGSDSRVVNVSSNSHTSGDFNLKAMQGRSGYNKSKYYANSRLYQIMIIGCLTRRLQGTNVCAYAMRSGTIDSDVKKKMENPDNWSTTYNIDGALSKLVAGVNTCLNVCLHPKLTDLSGAYFSDGIPVSPSVKASDVKAQEVLWRYSLDCLKDHLSKDLLEDLQIDLEELFEQEAEKEKKR